MWNIGAYPEAAVGFMLQGGIQPLFNTFNESNIASIVLSELCWTETVRNLIWQLLKENDQKY